MKKYILVITILIVFYGSGFCMTEQDYKECTLFFSLYECSYGEKKNIDSVTYEIKETLIKLWNIHICSTHKKHYSKNFIAKGFRFKIMLSTDDLLTIKVYENLFGIEKEIFKFIQNKGSTVRYIFYGSASEPYLIHATLTGSWIGSQNMHYWIPPPRFLPPTKKRK